MSPDNLTAVYNQNPTIQSMYTLPEYLSLFGQGSYTPIQPTPTDPTPTPTPTPDPSQGIINANINQFQNQGGGDGPKGGGKFGNLDMNTAKEFNIDDQTVTGYKNLGSGLYQDIDGLNIQNLGIGSFGVMGLIEKAFGLDKKDPKYAGLFDKVSYKALIKNPALYKSFFDRQDKKKQDDLQKQINADNLAAAEKAAADKLAAEIKTQQDYNRARNTDNNMGGDNSNFGGDRGVGQDAGTAGGTGGRRGGAGPNKKAYGGMIGRSYFNGGIVSLRRR